MPADDVWRGRERRCCINTRKEQIEAIFGAAIELNSPEQRAVYLAKVCGDDNGLLREVEELIQAYHKAGGFLTAGSDHAEAVSSGEASGATVLLPVTEKPGGRIGRYRLLEQIGEGGCGVVYMVEQEEPVRRRVALKVIKLGMDTKQVVARFEAERQALALMDHPNIAQVFDGGATGTGRPYFVLELVRGVRITDYCDQNHLATADRLGCSFRSATPSSTPIRRGSSTGTSSRRAKGSVPTIDNRCSVLFPADRG